jgi:hypothetical protein
MYPHLILAAILAAIFAVASLGELLTIFFGTMLGPLSFGLWVILVVGLYLILAVFVKKLKLPLPQGDYAGYIWGVVIVGILVTATCTPILVVPGDIKGTPILQAILPWLYGTVVTPPPINNGGTNPIPALADVKLTNLLATRTSDVMNLHGVVSFYTGTVGHLSLFDSITITSGSGTTTKTVKNGDNFYVKLTEIGGKSWWWNGMYEVPDQIRDTQLTKYTLEFQMPTWNSTFTVTWMNGSTPIADYGFYNGTSNTNDYPELDFTVNYPGISAGWIDYFDYEKNVPRQLYFVIRLNNTGADNVGILTVPDATWKDVRSASNDYYYAFRIVNPITVKQQQFNGLVKMVDSGGTPIYSGKIPYSIKFDISGLTAGDSVRVGYTLVADAPFQHYVDHGGHYSGATTLVNGRLYLQV